MIIGISGRKQSGKGTAAQALISEVGGVIEVNFADPLKMICTTCFPGATKAWYGTEFDKAQIIGEVGASGRQIMQAVGQHLRDIWPDCWIHAYRKRVQNESAQWGVDTIVTTDVRYKNEIAAIHELGGVVLRLTRCAYVDKHSSEMDLDELEADANQNIAHAAQEVKHGKGVWFDMVISNNALDAEQTAQAVLQALRVKGLI